MTLAGCFQPGRSVLQPWLLRLLALGLGLLMTGCATGPQANPADPLEPWNRGVYKFNDALDRAVLKPVATVYQESTPELLRRGIGNFFANLEDAWTTVNSVLQLKEIGRAHV